MKAHTTNDERAFEPGELVQFAGCTYVVETNHGPWGAVGCYESGRRIAPFHWRMGSTVARRIGGRVAFFRCD
jgi:hypothetical protein